MYRPSAPSFPRLTCIESAYRRRLSLSRYLGFALALTAASFSPSSRVHAQAAEEAPPTEIVVTATRTETPRDQVGSTISVVTAKEIEAAQQRTVEEVLRTIPGIDIARSGGPGGNTAVFLRGANAEHTLVLIDGVEMNDPSNPSRSYNFANLAVENIERIEVLRGAQSVLYGSDAIGGVINIITKDGSDGREVSVLAEGGSYSTFNERVIVNTPFDGGSVALSVVRQDSDSISAAVAGDGNEEDDSYDNTTFLLRGKAQASEILSFDVMGRANESNTDLDNGGGPGQDDFDRLLESKEAEVRGGAALRNVEKTLGTNFAISYTRHKREDNSDPDEVSPEFLRSDFKGDLLSLDWTADAQLSSWQSLLAGVDWEEEQASSNYFSDGPFGPFESDFPEENAHTTAYFIQDQISVAQTFFTTAGIRLDDHSEFGDKVTWRLAPAVVLQESGTELRSSVGTGFKAPSLVQLYSSFGNEDLDAEESLSVDAGITQNFLDNRLSAGFSYFYNSFDDLITFNPETFILENIAEARAQGLEIFANATLLENLSLKSSFTYTDTEDKETGASLLRRARHKAAVGLSYAVTEKLSSDLQVLYTGPRFDNNFSTFPVERVKLASYTLVNLATKYQLSENVAIFARVENLFDEEYEEVDGFGTLGAGGYGGVEVKL